MLAAKRSENLPERCQECVSASVDRRVSRKSWLQASLQKLPLATRTDSLFMFDLLEDNAPVCHGAAVRTRLGMNY